MIIIGKHFLSRCNSDLHNVTCTNTRTFDKLDSLLTLYAYACTYVLANFFLNGFFMVLADGVPEAGVAPGDWIPPVPQ